MDISKDITEDISTIKALIVSPTPCGVYDGDEARWETSPYIMYDDMPGLGEPLCLFRTLDEAIEYSLTITGRVYLDRDAV